MKLKRIWSCELGSVWVNEDGKFFKKIDGVYYQMKKRIIKELHYTPIAYVTFSKKVGNVQIQKRFNCPRSIWLAYKGEIDKMHKVELIDNSNPKNVAVDNLRLTIIDDAVGGKYYLKRIARKKEK